MIPFRERVRGGLWWLGAGLGTGALFFLLPSSIAPEFLASGCIAAIVAALAMGARKGEEDHAVSALGGDTANAVLPPPAREMLERLPDPLMLLDDTSRVILANNAMVAVVGTDTHKKHV